MTESNNHKDLSLIDQYLRNKYWFIGSVIFCLLIAFIYLSFQPEQYKVSGKFIAGKNITVDDIKSKVLVQKVIDALPLQVSYYQKDDNNGSEISADASSIKVIFSKPDAIESTTEVTASVISDQVYKIIQKDTTTYFYFNKPVTDYSFAKFKVIKGPAFHTNTDPVILKFNDPDRLLDAYYKNFDVTAIDDGNNYLSLSVVTTTPGKGKDFFNKLIEVTNNEPGAAASNSNLPVQSNVNSGLARLQSDISTLKNKYAWLKHRAGILKTTTENTQNLNGVKRPSDLQLKVLDAIRPYAKSSVNQFVQIPDGYQVDDRNLGQLIGDFNKTELQKQRALQDSEANRAKIASLNEQIAILKSSIVDKIDIAKKGTSKVLPVALTNSANASYASVRDSMSLVDKQVKTLQRRYGDLSKSKTVKSTSATSNARLTLVQDSIESAAYTNAALIYFFALLTGLIVPLAFPYFRYLRFKSPNTRISNVIDFKKAGDWISELTQVKEID